MSSNGTKDMGASHSYRYVSVSVSTGYSYGWNSETTLWSNPNPSSTSAFGYQTVTLSYSISNYRYLKFIWKNGTSDSTQHEYITTRSEFESCKYQSYPFVSLGLRYVGSSSGATYNRGIGYVSSTQVYIGNCGQVTGTGSNNKVAIPLYIKGMN